MAFHHFILKVAGRCNLNCSYCYMYNLADQTWRNQPRIMSPATMDAVAHRIVGHCVQHQLDTIRVTFHGGEPLLMGIPRMQQLVDTLRQALSPYAIDYLFSLQTNGTLITDAWAEFFKRNDIYVNVSMDGSRDYHDQYRVDHSGRGSYDQVVAGITILRKHGLSPRLLSVVNLDSDPVATLRHFAALGFTEMDFNLPDANHSALPPGKLSFDHTPYGDWLIRLFDYWYHTDEIAVEIRLFRQMIKTLVGRGKRFDAISSTIAAFIETNGEMQPLDSLRSVAEGMTATGLNVISHPLDDLLNNPFIRIEQGQRSSICQQCPYFASCGSGRLHHRYDATGSFDNPSVYCRDLYLLISHIDHVLQQTLTLLQTL